MPLWPINGWLRNEKSCLDRPVSHLFYADILNSMIIKIFITYSFNIAVCDPYVYIVSSQVRLD